MGPDLICPITPYELGACRPEYLWSRLQLLAGNLHVLAGLALLAAGVAGSLPQHCRSLARELTPGWLRAAITTAVSHAASTDASPPSEAISEPEKCGPSGLGATRPSRCVVI